MAAGAVGRAWHRHVVGRDDLAGLVGLAGWWMTWIGSLITAGLAFLLLNGFAVDQYAVLRWHGRADSVRLVVLFGCAVVASAVRQLQLRHRRRAADGRLTRELHELTSSSLTQGARRHA